ncbi:40S ribosomal protein S30-B isoform A [Parastagonospora nodorum SN15]|uniref:40S ribosomal protein S30 n=1 Tax=Phaeosphaeria nodorum (strain SN15 / ATCC MYA-4574 / FGSC 10173) TaxID=321614 RepID=A0A7U2HXX8_PHANO|nr:40S ribosomal protein S30-B isoform A [Parastagonospora nodorum SN15]
MGKVHGSLARAGKVKSQTRKPTRMRTIILSPAHHIGMITATITIHTAVYASRDPKIVEADTLATG